MSEKRIISVDIGSTYTKGALFETRVDSLGVVAQTVAPTTTGNLAIGFNEVFRKLEIMIPGFDSNTVPVRFSSSARGGLKIAALGLTPDLTLSIAKMTAQSAGGKIVRAFSYQLTPDEIREMETLRPDIILFTGGTDGGNEKYILQNACLLSESALSAVILYAGNGKIKDAVLSILKNKEVVVTENVMPEIGILNMEPAREAIRKMFLEKIIDGKGLSVIADRVGSKPLPTPLAVFELVKQIPESIDGWNDFCLIDMGGATTDFYSNTKAFHGGDSLVLRGIVEPQVKRSVEGDLGLRVSAKALWDSEKTKLQDSLARENFKEKDFQVYIDKITGKVDFVPHAGDEKTFDTFLAKACVHASARRHAGTLSGVATPQGIVSVQKGKDLRQVKRIIGSGGYLSRNQDAALLREACGQADDRLEEEALLPQAPEFFADKDYLFPLLGNLVPLLPKEAANTAVRHLVKLP